MSNSPKISIVLCFYNEERFLPEAVASVLAQDYESWELLLVDDGSSDASTRIARQLQDEYPERIFCLHHPGFSNRGLSASRNLGIANARGEYVAFIDADDVWLPEKLSRQIDIFSRHPEVTVVLEASEYWRSWSDQKEHDIVVPVGASEGVYSPPELMLSLYPLGKGAAPCPSGIMIKRTSLRRSFFEESFRGIHQMYEDQAFLCKVYLNEIVFVSAACNNRYRQRPSSLVASVHHSGNYHVVREHYLKWFEEYLESHPSRYASVWRLLRKANSRYRLPWLYKLRHDFPVMAKYVCARILVKMGLLTYRKSW